MQFTKSLFTERNRKLAKAAVPYLRTTKKMGKLQAEEAAQNLPYAQMRPRELTPKQFGEVADALSN
jgi:16S rRNA A1518/A1519 N6-dimethyltransferase RsmA/KsgA/DIM1 with predicted DNA glycosylase/AP lyase activity